MGMCLYIEETATFLLTFDADFSKSPNTAFGSHIIDDLPDVVKLASNDEATIMKELNSDKFQTQTNHTIPLLDVFHIDSDEVLIMPAYSTLNDTTPQHLFDVIHFTKQLLEVLVYCWGFLILIFQIYIYHSAVSFYRVYSFFIKSI